MEHFQSGDLPGSSRTPEPNQADPTVRPADGSWPPSREVTHDREQPKSRGPTVRKMGICPRERISLRRHLNGWDLRPQKPPRFNASVGLGKHGSAVTEPHGADGYRKLYTLRNHRRRDQVETLARENPGDFQGRGSRLGKPFSVPGYANPGRG